MDVKAAALEAHLVWSYLSALPSQAQRIRQSETPLQGRTTYTIVPSGTGKAVIVITAPDYSRDLNWRNVRHPEKHSSLFPTHQTRQALGITQIIQRGWWTVMRASQEAPNNTSPLCSGPTH